MSLISKQIEELRAYAADRKGELAKIVSDAADTIATLSEKLSAANINNGWIPVTERLPEEEQDVLVTVFFKGLEKKHKSGWNEHIKPKFYVDIASRIDDHWSSYSDEYKVAKNRHEVVAWKPLPEPWDDGSNYDREFWGDDDEQE